jgi:3-oxoacyl-[acyl-carrier-protein] synthase-3
MIFKNKIIRGIGTYIPDTVIDNETLAATIPTTDKWIVDNLGIRERRVFVGGDVADMGLLAARQAIYTASITPAEVDAVIVSCSSPSYLAPSVASKIIDKLGITVPAFDINAVCAGFVYAMELGCLMLDGGYKNVLIVATEQYSSITDWDSRDCVYFGDGAGAIVLTRGDGTITTNINANGKSEDAFVVPVGEKFRINGHRVYNSAVEILPEAINKILAERNMTIKDIDYIVPHQAGIRVLRDIAAKSGFDMKKCVTIMEKYGNIASASIPVALERIWPIYNENILMVTIGSGWVWGTAIIEA